MEDDEFNQLVKEALIHDSYSLFTITRLSIALRTVVDATGEPGAQALRELCAKAVAEDNPNEIPD